MRTSLRKYQLGILLLVLSVHADSFAAQDDPISDLSDSDAQATVISEPQESMTEEKSTSLLAETQNEQNDTADVLIDSGTQDNAKDDLSESEVQAAAVSESEDSMAEESAEDEAVLATDKEEDLEDELDTDGRVFGYRHGLLHGALALQGEWTDNLYNYDLDKQENFLTRITPSVWFTWPKRYRRPLQIAADNTAPGGMQYSMTEYDVFNKYQVYLAGKMDFMSYSTNSELDHVEQGVEGLFQYQPKGRLNFHLLEKYTHSQDIFNITEATVENNRVYDSNIFGIGVDWQLPDKFSVQMSYRHFLLLYEEEINNFLDRTDNGFEGNVFYDYSPKTNFFLGYQYLLASYDEGKMPDNGNTFFNAGINWQATVKTALMLKAGYQEVNYEDEDPEYDEAVRPDELIEDNDSGFHFEAQASWQATQKTDFLLNSKYSIEQTDSEYALNKAVFVIRLALGYRFTNRITGDINYIYEESDYQLFDGDSRLDDRWYWKPELRFALNKWLFFNLYYSFDKKDSNFNELDYETNTLGIGLRGSL
ncbi:MAG: hypothetical protein D3924_07975 [Candidatus Electrothrix sp. AR4]|nr:hypothetical protein [Candidatus Electrothrix sp. AR4]